MKNREDNLKLKNQLCFPLYAASRLFTREYQPHLEKLGITYPQYLVLLVLWEQDELSVNEIAKKLLLNTNTVTPLLKRMETDGIVNRISATADERKIMISLTAKGKRMKEDALCIPEKLAEELLSGSIDRSELITLKVTLEKIISYLGQK